MNVRTRLALAGLMGSLAWPGAAESQEPGAAAPCTPMPNMAVEGRASPYDSTLVAIDALAARICYNRPSARGREVFGGLVPYGRLWRTGANEPTILHLPFAAEIAGLTVEPGSYALYTVPGESEWELIVNRSITQWGHESRYTDEVRAQELGRATVRSERLDDHVEMFTIRAEPVGPGAANLLLEWETTRVSIPFRIRR